MKAELDKYPSLSSSAKSRAAAEINFMVTQKSLKFNGIVYLFMSFSEIGYFVAHFSFDRLVRRNIGDDEVDPSARLVLTPLHYIEWNLVIISDQVG